VIDEKTAVRTEVTDLFLNGKAIELLHDPNLLGFVKETLDEDIVGEVKNKLYIFLMLLSGKRKEPKQKQIIVLKGEPGGGKTVISNVETEFFKTKKVGRFTEHALDYTDLSQYEVLYLQEILDADEEGRGKVSTLRFLSADDQGYTVEVTVGDPKSGYTTQTYTIPPMTVITTTAKILLEPQFERRGSIVNVDESEEQTKAILNMKAEKEIKRFLELIGERGPSKNKEILKLILQELEDVDIILTTPKTLKQIFDTSVLRVRGDYDKIAALVKMVAFLYQKQRPYMLVNERKVVFTLPQDVFYALEIGLEPLLTMSTGLEKRLRDLFPALKELYGYHTRIGSDEFEGFKVSDFKSKIKRSHKGAYRLLEGLVDADVLTVEKPKGNVNVYQINISLSDLENKLKSSTLLINIHDFVSNLRKEAESFFLDYWTSVFPEGIPKELTFIFVPKFLQMSGVQYTGEEDLGLFYQKESELWIFQEKIYDLSKKPLKVIKRGGE